MTSLLRACRRSLERLVRRMTRWAWILEIQRLEWDLDDAKRHVESMQLFMRDSYAEPNNMNAEIDRLRRLLRETRMTFRRIKGRPGGVDINWPHPPNPQAQPRRADHE